jgi:hypothetical protein
MMFAFVLNCYVVKLFQISIQFLNFGNRLGGYRGHFRPVCYEPPVRKSRNQVPSEHTMDS